MSRQEIALVDTRKGEVVETHWVRNDAMVRVPDADGGGFTWKPQGWSDESRALVPVAPVEIPEGERRVDGAEERIAYDGDAARRVVDTEPEPEPEPMPEPEPEPELSDAERVELLARGYGFADAAALHKALAEAAESASR